MKSAVTVLGLGLFVLLGLHSIAPVFGLQDGFLADWMIVVLVLALVPLGAHMVILKHRTRREIRERARQRAAGAAKGRAGDD